MSIVQPEGGIMGGAGGQAIAQMLQNFATRNQPQPQAAPDLMSQLPNFIQARNQEATTNQAVQNSQFELGQAQLAAQRKQQALDLMQKLGQPQGGGQPQLGGPVQQQAGQSSPQTSSSPQADAYGQLGYSMALSGNMDNAQNSFAAAIKQRTDDQNKMALATLQHDILNANIDPNNPEAGLVQLMRGHSPEDLKAVAAATGNDPKVLQATLDSMTNLVVSGKMNMVRPVLDSVVDQLDEMYNSPGGTVMATHEKTADKTLSSIIGAAAQKFVQANPNSGMTVQQISELVHQSLPNGLASLKSIVDIHNVASQAFEAQSKPGEIQAQQKIDQQNANTASENASTTRYGTNAGLTFDQMVSLSHAKQKPILLDGNGQEIQTMTIGPDGMPVQNKETSKAKYVMTTNPITGQPSITSINMDGSTSPVQQGTQTSQSGTTRVVNGHTYVKVQGGWKLQK